MNIEKSSCIWSKNFILVILTNLLIVTSNYFLIACLPIYITKVLNGNEQLVGYAIGIFSIISVGIRPIAGYLFDNRGRKKVLIPTLICYLLCFKLYGLAISFVSLVAIRALTGIFWGVNSTGLGTVASDLVPVSKRGEGIGYYGLSSTLAMAIGPTIALSIIDNGSFNNLFNVGCIMVLIGVIALFNINYKEEISLKREKGSLELSDFIEVRVKWIAIIMFVVSLAFGGIISFIVIYGSRCGVSNPGRFFAIYALVLLFSRPIAGKSFDKNGPMISLNIAFVSGMICFILLYFVAHTSIPNLLFMLSAFAMGITHGICVPSSIAMALNKVEDTKRGGANATLLSAQDLGMGLGAIILGEVAKVFGLDKTYLLCAFMFIIPMVVFWTKEARFYKKNLIRESYETEF